MPRYEFRTPRLYIKAALSAGGTVSLDRDQANYLLNVLRLKSGQDVLVFNGRDGEWQASLMESGRRQATLAIAAQLRPQPPSGDLHFLFAPLKHARLDYLVQKAVEMGASYLQPVITRHTQVARVNIERMRANVVEAAQQCGVLAVPGVGAPIKLDAATGDQGRLLVFCDEDADVKDPVTVLGEAKAGLLRPASIAVLVGPEGGFADEERAALLERPRVVRIALGPRILRADTAAVAALTLVQAVLGDWLAAD
ncbi:MAG TPA: 16S rRNA (uracil(1498)-N(3))-methyltransferase [Pseudolabrys sp.]|nr:16S rRNA (uracil(1498)-N(3))-methyltransferase [Pseudolabrys sp.]